MICKDEKLISICELNETQEIIFTKEYLDIFADSSYARAFASQLITHWSAELSTLLDYFGFDESETDMYTGIDGEPMDVREDIPELWEYYELLGEGLTSEWYRDMLRAKLLSIKIPERLLKEFVNAKIKQNEQ